MAAPIMGFSVPVKTYVGPLNGNAPDGTPLNGAEGTAMIVANFATREEAIAHAREEGALGYFDHAIGLHTLVSLP